MATTNESLDISDYVVRDDDGKINPQKSQVRFTQDLNVLMQAERADAEVIGRALDKVWSERQDKKRIPLGALVHAAMQHLEFEDENFSETYARVANFIRLNKQLYSVDRGKGGGVSRVVAPEPSQTRSSVPPSGSVRPKAS